MLTLVLLLPLVTGCTPRIPVKDSFGTSTLVPSPDIPPEFAEFNAYDPSINPLLGDQICATEYQQIEAKSIDAVPGRIVQANGRCRTHVPLLGDAY